MCCIIKVIEKNKVTSPLLSFASGFVSSDQVLFSDTSIASSTLNTTLMAHSNDDTIWFEAKLAKEPQRSYTHEDFVASVSLISSEEAHDKSLPSCTSTVELIEEERKEMEEKHGDVEILMAVSKSSVGYERPDLDSTEQLDDESLDWAGNGKMQDMSYWPKTVQRMGSSMKTSVMMVNETMEQHSKINESGDRKQHDVFLPSIITEEKNKEDVNSSENKKGGLDSLLIDVSSNDEEFPVGSDELLEQGLVRNLDLTQDSNDDYFSEGV